MRRVSLLAVMSGMLLALPAAAQNPLAQAAPSEGTTTRIRGTIETLDGKTLRVNSRDGQQMTIGLADNFTVVGVARRSLADIKAGDYVASTSASGTDGKLHALEIHIFPEAMRGVGEGQRPTDLAPDSLMTNARGLRHLGGAAGPSAKGHLQGRRGRGYHRSRDADRYLCPWRHHSSKARRHDLLGCAEEGRRQSVGGAGHHRERRRQAANVAALRRRQRPRARIRKRSRGFRCRSRPG